MKGKLVKEYGNFYLISDKEIESGDEYVKLGNRPRTLLLGTTVASAKVPKLSLKNCQAIENGYDLDELAESEYGTVIESVRGSKEYDIEADRKSGFKTGFKKALEILGDKKFSEEDISKAIDFGVHVEAGNIDIDYKRYDTKENQFIQSLQQTEFDVEILMGTNYRDIDCVNEGNLVASKIVKDNEAPMLDKEGCLILKRI